MVDRRSSVILLLAIVAVGFMYRFSLMTINTYPPGADIGLHESVINSILSPKTSFFYNYYHMGGGISVTNPGYHIFAAFIISMTGAPDYLVQAAVASLFSALIILAAFMVTKLVWGELAGFIAAILICFSASDILMLSWAGYPNIVALALIPVLFYLLLQPTKLASKSYLAIAVILTAALFLTHIFSGIVFLAITLFALIVNLAFSKSTGFTLKKAVLWLAPLAVGVLLVSPYLINVLPVYFGSQGAITGSVAVMKQAVVETRLVSTVILGLAIIPIALFVVFSKKQTGKFFTVPSVLFASAVLVPLAAAQSYLLGFFLDYERFLYFLALPAMVCLAVVIVKASGIVSRVADNLAAHKPSAKPRYIKLKPVLICALLVLCLFTPLFTLPQEGFARASYFQLMNPTKYEAVQWIKNNTSQDSVCVADAEFGWWLSGFAQRPTLSAVDPQFLILQREFEPARVASDLLMADYLVDNGLLQVKQEGRFANGSAHDIYAVLNNSIVKPLVFSLNDTQISLLYREGGVPKQTTLGEFSNSGTQVAGDSNQTFFDISRENSAFRVTEEITIFRGVRFAEVTFVFQNLGDVNFDWLRIPFQSRGFVLQYANSVGVVDNVAHMINQIVLQNSQLGSDVMLQENPDFYELVCNLKGKSAVEFSFFIGLCPFDSDSDNPPIDYYNSLIENNAKTHLDKVSNAPINCFDYQAAIQQWSISYVVLRDSESVTRFSNDPVFELAFKNNEVSIFRVVKTS